MPRCAKPTSARRHEDGIPSLPRAGCCSCTTRGDGRGRTEVHMLEVADVATAYGKIEALRGVSLAAAKGRITCLLGPNGAGKTTLMYHDRRHPQAQARLHPPVGRGDRRPRQRPDRRPRPRPGAGEPPGIPADERQGEPRGRRLPAPRRCRRRRGHRAHVRAFPPAAGAPRAARRHALGRRAADAGRGARADVPPAHPADGRAVARPRAHDRRGGVLASSPTSTATASPSSWSSRTRTWR